MKNGCLERCARSLTEALWPIVSLTPCRLAKISQVNSERAPGVSAELSGGPSVTNVPLRVIRNSLCSSRSSKRIEPEVSGRTF
jgi:hypothetical protein